jgi:hypothetical protein
MTPEQRAAIMNKANAAKDLVGYVKEIQITPEFTKAFMDAMRQVCRYLYVHRHKGRVRVKRGNPYRRKPMPMRQIKE